MANRVDEEQGFVPTLAILRSGEAAAELDQLLSDAVGAVRATGKKAVVTLKITLKMGSKGRLMVEDEPKATLPQPLREATLFFPTEDNQLSRFDHDQKELFEGRGENVSNFRKAE